MQYDCHPSPALISRAAADIRSRTRVTIFACYNARILWSVIRDNIYSKIHLCCDNHILANHILS